VSIQLAPPPVFNYPQMQQQAVGVPTRNGRHRGGSQEKAPRGRGVTLSLSPQPARRGLLHTAEHDEALVGPPARTIGCLRR